jgi:soluble lytic murein transglycosylase-like protein
MLPVANQSMSALDPFYNFAKPRLETLLTPPPEKDETQIAEVEKQAREIDLKQARNQAEEKEFIRKETIRSNDLVTLHALDPKLAKEKLDSKHTDIEKEIRVAVQKICKKYKADPKLIEAMIIVESERYYKAVSKEKAGGLMQIMPDTARKLKVRDRFNPVDNINGGVKYITYLLKIYNGNVKLALAAYNAGPGRVAEYGNTIPPIPETQNYVVKVMRNYEKLKNQG